MESDGGSALHGYGLRSLGAGATDAALLGPTIGSGFTETNGTAEDPAHDARMVAAQGQCASHPRSLTDLLFTSSAAGQLQSLCDLDLRRNFAPNLSDSCRGRLPPERWRLPNWRAADPSSSSISSSACSDSSSSSSSELSEGAPRSVRLISSSSLSVKAPPSSGRRQVSYRCRAGSCPLGTVEGRGCALGFTVKVKTISGGWPVVGPLSVLVQDLST
jgi:hypothetical protein